MGGESYRRLRVRLDLMKTAQVDGFDRPAFACIEALVERSQALPAAAREVIEEQARFRLSEYQTEYNQARDDVHFLLEDFSHAELYRDTIDSFLSDNDYRGLIRFLNRQQKDTRTVFQRKSVSHDLMAALGSREDLAQLDLLAELELRDAPAEAEVDGESGVVKAAAAVPGSRYSPLSLLREQTTEEKNRLAVGTARKGKPEVAGPLNSQTLATQLLEELEAISPIYVKRLVSHLEIIRLLHQVPKPSKRKGAVSRG